MGYKGDPFENASLEHDHSNPNPISLFPFASTSQSVPNNEKSVVQPSDIDRTSAKEENKEYFATNADPNEPLKPPPFPPDSNELLQSRNYQASPYEGMSKIQLFRNSVHLIQRRMCSNWNLYACIPVFAVFADEAHWSLTVNTRITKSLGVV